MKTIILAGGFGTRLSEYTELRPKPMVEVGGHPILWHIMQYYARFGHQDFFVALGYKAAYVKEFFRNYYSLNSDFTVNLSNGKISYHEKPQVDWNVTLVDTGLKSMTGGRVRRMKKYIGNETCMLTYGDGLSNVDLGSLLEFHKKHGKMVTVTAVHPVARFGDLSIDNSSKVTQFLEKPQTEQGWINGGFFVVEPEFFDLIESDTTVLEKEPLEKVAEAGELMAFYHHDFWQCMDTVRDHQTLEKLWNSGNAPWVSDGNTNE